MAGKLIVVGHRKADGNFQLAPIPKSIRIFDEQIQIEGCFFKARYLRKIQTSHDRYIRHCYWFRFDINSLKPIKISPKFYPSNSIDSIYIEIRGNETSKGDESINFMKFVPVVNSFRNF